MNVFRFELFIVIAVFIFKSTSGDVLCDQLDGILHEYAEIDVNEVLVNMRVQVYSKDSIGMITTTKISIEQPELIYQHIDPLKPLVVYIHGFQESPSSESVKTIVAVHSERGNDNIIVFDWSKLAYDNYIKVVVGADDISRIFAAVFDKLIDLGLNLEHCHIIGHSLGAQIAGLIGKYSRYSIPRVTGLDPAFPGFYHCDVEHIDNKSARFVDIISTDRGFYGACMKTGHVNILPNDGVRPQPGCDFIGFPLSPQDLCSHWRSWRYYAESVKNSDAFAATECHDYFSYEHGACRNNHVIRVGYDISTDARGTFYMTTNSESPFGQNYRKLTTENK